MPYCLQIIPDPDDAASYRWIILEQEPNEALVFKPHSASQCDFDSWAAALDAGTLALAAVEGQPYENEAADPVGDADCSDCRFHSSFVFFSLSFVLLGREKIA